MQRSFFRPTLSEGRMLARKGVKMIQAHINKQQIQKVEADAEHVCFHCLSARSCGGWRRVGRLVIGELWICEQCWEEAVDISLPATSHGR